MPSRKKMSVQHRFVFYDTECTTNKPADAAIISIGAQITVFNDFKRQFIRLEPNGMHSYVHTERDSEAAAFAVHKITKEKLRGAPKFPAAIDLLKAYLKPFVAPGVRLYFIAHNGRGFDDVVMFCNFRKNLMDFYGFVKEMQIAGFIDTLPMLKKIFETQPVINRPCDAKTGKVGYTLGNCYQKLCGGNQLEGAHDALVDTQALVDVCNSPNVCIHLNTQQLFKFKDSDMKHIKSVAGNSMQETERQVQQTMPISSEPLWTFGTPRLCLNCVSFVDHDQCDRPFQSIADKPLT